MTARETDPQHDGLHCGGGETEDEADFDADLIAEIRADLTLPDVDGDREQQAREGETGLNGTRDTAPASAICGAEESDQAGGEGEPDDGCRRHRKCVAGELALGVSLSDAQPPEETQEEHQDAERSADHRQHSFTLGRRGLVPGYSSGSHFHNLSQDDYEMTYFVASAPT